MRSFLIGFVAPLTVFYAVLICAVVTAPKPNNDTFAPFFMAPILGLIAFGVWNSGYRQGATGQSIGRRVTKTKLVKIETGEPIAFGMALLRQTIADKIVKAVVVRIDDATA